jgi:hypothetical protein
MKTIPSLHKTAAFVFIMLFSSFLAQAQTKGSGNLTKEDREVSSFTEIEAGSAFEILLEQGEPLKVTVETDDNYQENIKVTVEDNRLKVSSGSMKNPTAMRIYITAPEISRIITEGAARLDSKNDLKVTNLSLDASGASRITLGAEAELISSNISGASKVYLKGHSSNMKAEVSGAAMLEAIQLVTQSAELEVSGAAKAKVYAVSSLNAEVSGAGNLSYFETDEVKRISTPGTYNFTFQNPENPENTEAEAIITSSGLGDSTLISIGDIKVQVVEGDPVKVTIGNNELEVDEDGNVDFKRDRKDRDRYDGHWGGFDLGINGYVNGKQEFDLPEAYDFLDLRWEKSINVAINFWEQNFNLINNQLGLTTGLGLNWNNYRFEDRAYITRTSEGISGGFYPAGGERNYTKSKLVVSYLTLPLLLEFQTNRFSKKNSFHIGGGLLTGLKIGSHTKMVYNDGSKQKDKYRDSKGFDINPFRFDLMARIGWGKINLYANYSLNTLFKNNRGPELYPFSAGITLASW